MDLSTFDYSTGTMNSTLIKPRGRMPKTAKDKVSIGNYNITPAVLLLAYNLRRDC